MFDGLDKIEWHRLQHAYGSAADVPKLLRLLRSDDEMDGEHAIHCLFENIWHQGTVYEATTVAVPFLLELLKDPSTQLRDEIAILLGLIARGRSYHEVHDPSKQPLVEQEMKWARSARAAVRQGVGLAVALLAEDHRLIRGTAAHILACFPEDAAVSKPALESALDKETDSATRCALALSLACLGEFKATAFERAEGSDLPVKKLRMVAELAASGKHDRDAILELLLDIATGTFCEGDWDELLERTDRDDSAPGRPLGRPV